MPMKSPPHPGRIVRQECLEPLGLSVTDAAKALGVSHLRDETPVRRARPDNLECAYLRAHIDALRSLPHRADELAFCELRLAELA